MDLARLDELVFWKQEAQIKRQTFVKALQLQTSLDFKFNKTQYQKLKFKINAFSHEIFLVDSLIDEELKSIDISSLKNIINYEL